MGADKNSARRRWKLQQDEHGFQHTSPTHYPSWPSPRSHWSATGPRNQHTTFRPENAVEHQTPSLQTNTGQTGEHHLICTRQGHRPLQPLCRPHPLHCRPLHQHLHDQSHVAELKRYNKRCTRYFVNLNSILMITLCYLSLVY
jgi:hypothetical protein